MSYVIWDLETTIRTSYKRKANPFDPLNYVVMQGYKRFGGKVIGEYYGKTRPTGDWFTKLIAPLPPEVAPKMLVGLNIKFDLLYALRESTNHEAWMQWVSNGGTIWDCQLAEYLLEGMAPTEHMLSMDEIAPRYGGNTKYNEVKDLWDAGVETYDIDPDLLRRYLCGDREEVRESRPGGEVYSRWVGEHGDIGNTEVIFRAQLARAKASGQLKSLMLNMGSLLCTTEMELNGMAVDVELGRQQAAKVAADLADLTVELVKHLPEDLPFDFNWNSTQQKSALIFGGTVGYKKRTPTLKEDGTQAYVLKKVKAYYTTSGMVPVEEYNGAVHGAAKCYTSGKYAGEYKTKDLMVDDLERPKIPFRDYEYTFPRIAEPKKQWQGSVAGVYSTSAEVIKALTNRGIPFLEMLGKVTGLTKDLGTYYIVEDDKHPGQFKGMLTLVQATGIIHHMLNHCSTVTARFSSSNPNLQNLPKEGKSTVKMIFVSRFSGGKIIQSDFTALEVYVQAVLTKCLQLIEDLRAGLDMHCARVATKEGCAYEEALLWCKGDEAYQRGEPNGVPPREGWPKKRTDAKVFSFQRAYGAGATLISEDTGIPIDDVKALIAAEEIRYPEVETYYAELTRTIKANSEPTNKFAQHPDVPHLTCNFRKSHFQTPDGKLYTYRESPAPEFLAKRPLSKGGCTTSFSPTEIKNYVVQGEGGEWAKAAMLLALRAFYKTGNFGGKALLVNQVHDAVYVDSSPEVALKAAATLHACMEAASEFMEWYFDWPVPVPVPSETMMGSNMMEETPMPSGFKELAAKIRVSVRRLWIGNGYVPSFERTTNYG